MHIRFETIYSTLCILYPLAISPAVDFPGTVRECPSTEKEWNIRKFQITCDEGKSLVYHCLLDLSGQSTEVCHQRRIYFEGCPWVLVVDKNAYLGVPATPCENKKYCPNGTTPFFSDELYKYPACLVKEEQRANYSLPDKTVEKKYEGESSNQNQKSEESNTVTVVMPAVSVMMVIVINVVALAVFCWKRRKAENAKNNTLENQTLKETWNIRKIIKTIDKEDNPKIVNELYPSENIMDEKFYKEYVARRGITEGSLLMYAEKMDRRETVLVLLQRQKKKLHVFKADTYAADKNQDILHAAIKKGWNDVIDELRGIYDPETDEGISYETEKSVSMNRTLHNLVL